MYTHSLHETSWLPKGFADASHFAQERGVEFEDIAEPLSDRLCLCFDPARQMVAPDLCLDNRTTRENHLVHASGVLEHQLPGMRRSVTLQAFSVISFL
jgi:hypothetical protein